MYAFTHESGGVGGYLRWLALFVTCSRFVFGVNKYLIWVCVTYTMRVVA